jgi:hypothetical protein
VGKLDMIPTNYRALFGFIGSIRSPRRHGRGLRPVKVPVGPAEALLMGNHVRALLVYLAHRPSDLVVNTNLALAGASWDGERRASDRDLGSPPEVRIRLSGTWSLMSVHIPPRYELAMAPSASSKRR